MRNILVIAASFLVGCNALPIEAVRSVAAATPADAPASRSAQGPDETGPSSGRRFRHPQILREGVRLNTGDEGVEAACAGGDLELYPVSSLRKPGCKEGRELMDRAFYDVALPAIDQCIRKALPEGALRRGEPVQVFHMGLCQYRNVAGTGSLSLHHACRAIDISHVRAGSVTYEKARSWKARDADWEEFWLPLFDCMGGVSEELFIITGVERPRDHWNHLHVSMPLPEDHPARGDYAGGLPD
jgi:hypothetical protein